MENINLAKILTDIVKKTESKYLLLTSLYKLINTEDRKLFGLHSGMKTDEIANKIYPIIGDDLQPYKIKTSNYVVLKNCEMQIVIHYIQNNPNKTHLQVIQVIPLDDIVIINSINKLIKEGSVSVYFDEKVKPKYSPKLFSLQNQVPIPKTEVWVESDDKSLFKKSYDNLIRGKRYIKIYDIRRKLGWDRDRFDRLLEKLRDEDLIFLQPADTSIMDDQDVRDSFIDENNLLMVIVSWRKS